MIKSKKRIILFGLVLLLTLFSFWGINGYYTAKADTAPCSETNVSETEVSPRLFTTLNLGIGGAEGAVRGNVTNTFTLGFSTVRVYVELYSSYTYQESYTAMTLESRSYFEDLNIGKTIETRASTGGETKYWMARARYRVNSSDWAEKVTSLWLFDGDGNVIR